MGTLSESVQQFGQLYLYTVLLCPSRRRLTVGHIIQYSIYCNAFSLSLSLAIMNWTEEGEGETVGLTTFSVPCTLHH